MRRGGVRRGVAYEWCWTRIDELMLRACRDDHQVSGFHVLVFAGYGGFAGAGGEG